MALQGEPEAEAREPEEPAAPAALEGEELDVFAGFSAYYVDDVRRDYDAFEAAASTSTVMRAAVAGVAVGASGGRGHARVDGGREGGNVAVLTATSCCSGHFGSSCLELLLLSLALAE